jgi:hypothetical protein
MARPMRIGRLLSMSTRTLLAIAGCAGLPDKAPETDVVLNNQFSPSAASPSVVYQAYWLNVAFSSPVAPGASSDPQIAVPASANTAYVLLAPGWDPTSGTTPTAFVVLRSKHGYGVDLGGTLHIPISDEAFDGDCAAEDPLDQSEADFLTGVVFASAFAGLAYDANTCTTTATGDAGGP